MYSIKYIISGEEYQIFADTLEEAEEIIESIDKNGNFLIEFEKHELEY